MGSRSGCIHTPSRASVPWRVRSEPHSVEASRSRRGRSSRPTREAKVCSAGPPGGAAAAYGLLEPGRGGHPLGGGLADDLVDPALHQREGDLEPRERGLLGGGGLQVEEPALEGLLHRRGVGRVDPAQLLLDRAGVDLDAARVVAHGPDQVLAQPRHVGEEALVGGLAQREVEQHVVVAHVEAVGERRHVARHERGRAGGAEGEPDVGRRQHLAGQPAERGADLAGDHRAGGLADHPEQRPGHRPRLLGQRVAERLGGLGGHGLDEHLPDVGGADDPLGARPRGGRGDAGGERRGRVEPVVGETYGVRDRGLLLVGDARVGRLGGLLAGHVDRDVPVDRAVVGLHQRLDLGEERGQVGHRRPGRRRADGPPKRALRSGRP